MSRRRWLEEFPYHWDADEAVTRRGLLLFSVVASGALFLGTAVLAALGWVDDRVRRARRVIARVDEVPEGRAFYFAYPTSEDQAVLIHLSGGRFVAFSQKCTHLSCAVHYEPERGRLFCPCHEGVFDPETGEPTAGPPERRLPRIAVRREGDRLVAVEEAP